MAELPQARLCKNQALHWLIWVEKGELGFQLFSEFPASLKGYETLRELGLTNDLRGLTLNQKLLELGPLLTLEAGSWNVSWTMENHNTSLAKDMYPGARLERWCCNMLPRTCVLLWGQTAWLMPLNHSTWTQEGGLPAPACSRLGQICKACFACQNLGLSELVFLLFSPDSFLSKQLRKKKIVENNSLKKGDCVSTAGVPIMGQMLGKKKFR